MKTLGKGPVVEQPLYLPHPMLLLVFSFYLRFLEASLAGCGLSRNIP